MGTIGTFLILGFIYFIWNVLEGWDVDDEVPPIIDEDGNSG